MSDQTIPLQKKSEVVRNLIIQELELLTHQKKIDWFKLTSAQYYNYKAVYRGVEVLVAPKDGGFAPAITITELDNFGRRTSYQASFDHAQSEFLVSLIASTNPPQGDVVHNKFFPRDTRTVEEQVLGQLLIGRSPLEPSHF